MLFCFIGKGGRRTTIYRLHCHSIVGCEESPVGTGGGAGLPGGCFVSVTDPNSLVRANIY